MNWMVPERRLDERQLEVLRLCGNTGGGRGDHHWIRGYAGTGKTVLLVHLIEGILANDERASICVATYTHALKDLIASGLREDCDERVRVMTHLQLLHENREYDWIMLDEVQDIPATDLRGIRRLARHVVAAGDTDQSIYEKCSTESQIRACLEPQVHTIEVLHRLTQKIRDIACCVMPNPRIRGAPTDRMQEVEVTLAHAESVKFEVEWVWENLKKYSRVGDPAVALFPRRKDIRSFLRQVCRLEDKPEPEFQGKDYDPVNAALQEYDIPLQYLGSGYGCLRESDSRKISYVMTYHSAKGLDFETVFLPRLAKGRTFWKDDEGIDRRLFFVGLTRSRRNLFLSYHGSEPHRYVQSIPDRLLHRVECKTGESQESGSESEPELFF